jgi:hypothetical protein
MPWAGAANGTAAATQKATAAVIERERRRIGVEDEGEVKAEVLDEAMRKAARPSPRRR